METYSINNNSLQAKALWEVSISGNNASLGPSVIFSYLADVLTLDFHGQIYHH